MWLLQLERITWIGGRSVPAALKDYDQGIYIDLRKPSTFIEIKQELKRKLGLIDSFPLGASVNIDFGNKHLSNKQIREIEDILLDNGLHLSDAESNRLMETEVPADDNPFSFLEPNDYTETDLICRHLRSGQKFIGQGNIVVLGDINPGAEVIAGGNIFVMGNLKGMAHAGAYGDENAVIAAFRLSPTQLRIAKHITRPPDGKAIKVNDPEMARIRDGKVIIEKLKI